MSDVVRFGKYTKTFNIKVYYDRDGMEVQAIELSDSFERLNDLAKADLLQDVVHELDTQRGESFENYADDVKIAQIEKKAKLKAVK